MEAHADAKATIICFVCIGFTVKHNNQILKASYAQHQWAHQAQKKVMEIRTREGQTNNWKDVAKTWTVDSTGKDIETACQLFICSMMALLEKSKC